MYGVIDCDNCFVSCEKVFRPDLEGKPVVVLSNNDGCVVSRSNEAKAMGVKMGMPFFQMKQQFPNVHIEAFSSNFELYGELTERVVSIIKKEVNSYFRYSIDECFIDIHGAEETGDLKAWGESLHRKILRWVGLPVSIGLAPNKTLAKTACYFAKKYTGYNHCCVIDTEEKRERALRLFPIGEVWGIGRKYGEKLTALGMKTAWDFAQMQPEWVRATLRNIVIFRTWAELRGKDCIPTEDCTKKKSICMSRSFAGRIADLTELETIVSNFAACCAEKLRRQGTVASLVGVFLRTDAFKETQPQYWNYDECRLLTPTSSSVTIVKTAGTVLRSIFRQGYQYKKAGVVLMNISSDGCVQHDFFDISPEKYEKLHSADVVMDRINRLYGKDTLFLGSQKRLATDGDRTAAISRAEHRSSSPTTRWSDIIKLK